MRSSLPRPLSGLLLLLRLRPHCILKCGIRSFREGGHCAALASPPGDGTRLRADSGPVGSSGRRPVAGAGGSLSTCRGACC